MADGDDTTNDERGRLERVEEAIKRLDEQVAQFGRRVTTVETRVEQIHGLVQQLRAETGQAANAATEERRALHAEQMRTFQDVVEKVRTGGK
jgi:hypothetical protein